MILLKMYDAPMFCGNEWEQDLLPAFFQCRYLSMTSHITSVFRFSPYICKHASSI